MRIMRVEPSGNPGYEDRPCRLGPPFLVPAIGAGGTASGGSISTLFLCGGWHERPGLVSSGHCRFFGLPGIEVCCIGGHDLLFRVLRKIVKGACFPKTTHPNRCTSIVGYRTSPTLTR